MDIFAQLIKDLGNKPRGNPDDLLKNIGSICNIPGYMYRITLNFINVYYASVCCISHHAYTRLV